MAEELKMCVARGCQLALGGFHMKAVQSGSRGYALAKFCTNCGGKMERFVATATEPQRRKRDALDEEEDSDSKRPKRRRTEGSGPKGPGDGERPKKAPRTKKLPVDSGSKEEPTKGSSKNGEEPGVEVEGAEAKAIKLEDQDVKLERKDVKLEDKDIKSEEHDIKLEDTPRDTQDAT